MRTSTFARAGVVLTASALAFSLSAGPSSAAETSTASATAATSSSPSTEATGFNAGSVSAAATPVSGLRFGSGTITSRGTTRFVGNGTFAGDGGATASVTVNGRHKGAVAVLFSPDQADNLIAVDIPRGWGSGKVRVNVNGVVSNTFYARKQTKTTRSDGYALRVKRRNSKITFSARQVKIVNPSNGRYVSAKRVKLQQFKGSSWKTIKTIRLNSKGNGSYAKTLRTKYRYRLYIPRNSTQERFATIKTGRI